MRLAAAALVLLLVNGAAADPVARGEIEVGTPDRWAFKLTPSYYVTERQKDAIDINLRANFGAHAMWIAHYRRGTEFEQSRTGYEYTLQLPLVQVVPSIQVASHGFAGGSINAIVGGPLYGMLGFGRTNLRDYYNLNFDPNDSIVAGVGTRLLPKSNVSLFTVQDNRLHTGQKVLHLVWRYTPTERERWTIDLSGKRGRPVADADPISGGGLSVTYEHGDVFFRLARDRKVNFGNDDQTRVSAGLRF